MSIFSFTFVILHLAFCCCTAKGEDVTLRCPKKWRNKCPTTVSCTLQTANFNSAVCSVNNGFENRTDFLFKANGKTAASSVCKVDFNTPCNGTFSDKGCACMLHSKNSYTFQYNVVTDDSLHANGSWSCEPVCFDISDTFALTSSKDDTCSSVVIFSFILEWCGIVLLCFGTALVIIGIIMIIAYRVGGRELEQPIRHNEGRPPEPRSRNHESPTQNDAGRHPAANNEQAAGLGIAGYIGYIGIALCVVGYILLIVGSALMTVAYVDDERAGIAVLWLGSIVLGIDILIICIFLQRNFGVRSKVGTCLMLFGGTLAIIGGIVATTERCPSDGFPTTLQEILGLVLALIGFAVWIVGIIIGTVAYQEG